MKKFLILVAIFCFIIPGHAGKIKVPFTARRDRTSEKNGNLDRVPSNLPFEIYYDDSARVIEIESEENLEGLVILNGKSGQVEDTSLSIDCTLVPSSFGLHEVEIYYDCWICTAFIEI